MRGGRLTLLLHLNSGHKGHHRGGDSGGWTGGGEQQDCGRGRGSDRVIQRMMKTSIKILQLNLLMSPSF